MATASTKCLFSPPFGLSANRRLSRWWRNRTVLTKGLLVWLSPCWRSCLWPSRAFALQMQERDQGRTATAVNAVVLSSLALAVLADATDGEAGVRGYAVTNDPLILQSYTAALGNVTADVDELLAAATTDKEQEQAAAVAATVAERFALLAEFLAAIRADFSDVGLSRYIDEESR